MNSSNKKFKIFKFTTDYRGVIWGVGFVLFGLGTLYSTHLQREKLEFQKQKREERKEAIENFKESSKQKIEHFKNSSTDKWEHVKDLTNRNIFKKVLSKNEDDASNQQDEQN